MGEDVVRGGTDVVADVTDRAVSAGLAVAGPGADLLELLSTATELAASPDQLLDLARAAAALGDAGLKGRIADRIAEEAADLLHHVGSWPLTMNHNKVDGWNSTGRRAAVLAEAWALVQP